MSHVVDIQRIEVKKGRLKIFAKVSGAIANTSPEIARAALETCPTLAEHTCINSSGPTFASVIENTSIPHLLEHLIIDVQVKDPKMPESVNLVGTTRWLDGSHREALIEISFLDDMTAFKALNGALELLDLIMARAAAVE